MECPECGSDQVGTDGDVRQCIDCNQCWYVRYVGSGQVSGPMSKEDALMIADGLESGGTVFNEGLFASAAMMNRIKDLEVQNAELLKVPDDEEVESILRNLQDMRGEYIIPGPHKAVLKKAMELITKLARNRGASV